MRIHSVALSVSISSLLAAAPAAAAAHGGLAGGLVGGLGGTVSGTLSGSSSATVGATMNGSGMSLGSGAAQNVNAQAPMLDATVDSWTDAYLKVNGSMANAIALENAQRAAGKIETVRAESVRGVVVAIAGDQVAFLSPNGEVRVIALAKGGVERLHLRTGSSVFFKSDDFGKTASLAVMALRRGSMLGDVFVGKIETVGRDDMKLAMDTGTQTFAYSREDAALLKSLAGKIVAVDSPDGVHVKSVLSAATLAGLGANVLSATSAKTMLQLPNGDVATYSGNLTSLALRPGAVVHVKPLDDVHALLSSGKRSVRVTRDVRDSVAAVVARTPTSIVLRYANGDVRTLLGDVQRVDAKAGSQVAVGVIDGSHMSLTANAVSTTLVDAQACGALSAGCGAMYGVLVASTRDTAQVSLADGETLYLRGSFGTQLGNVACIVQPLGGHQVLLKTAGAVVAADTVAGTAVSSR